MRLLRLALLAALCAAALPAPAARAATPPIGHVFTIILENEGAATTFADNPPAPYLAKTVRSLGVFVPNFYGIGHASLDDYLAMVSGQSPNIQTQADCVLYTDFIPGVPTTNGQVIGQGCVYPSSVQTVADQLGAKGLGWKGYMEDMGNAAGTQATCRHPALNSLDSTQSARANDKYAARHNPFVYFHSIIESPACNTNDVPLTQLPGDLNSTETTPNYAFITPNLCNDGHDDTCAGGGLGGFAAIDAFLRTWVPRILSSPAFQQDGLLIVTFDEADNGDSTACCNEQPGPNTINPGGGALSSGKLGGPGGGRVGAILISRFIAPGTVSNVAYNHYSMLRSVEDLFGLDHLGFAAQPGLDAFGADIFNAPPPSGGAQGAQPTGRSAPQAPCTTALLPKRRRLAPGTLVTSAILRRGSLDLALTHRARVVVRANGRRLVSRVLGPCAQHHLRLRTRPRAVTVRATVRRSAETRRVRRVTG